ncbi:MAG TPA: helix-turn-helix domain-containing protein [Planctomycetaceae bacterium]|nr:helix-turn-helix domain-containing protein [Planctomycetaceae bacterium]
MGTSTRNPERKPRTGGAQKELARLRAEVARLRAQVRALKSEQARSQEFAAIPALPPPNTDGNLPAEATLDVIVARQIIRRRRTAGWSQAELAARAGVRQETVSRLESGRHAPTVRTVDKLDRALREVGA